jgi:hypothetical protein
VIESEGPVVDVPPWWVDDFEASQVPPEAVDLEDPGPAEDPDDWLARVISEGREPAEDLDPWARFAAEFGREPTPEELDRFAPPSLERSVALQDIAVRDFQVRTIADARRMQSLLVAEDASIADLEVRFGAKVGTRDGMGGSAFASSMALLTKTDPRHLAHELTVGRFLRDRLPATWAAFQAGETTWARAQKAVKAAEGLADEHLPAFDAKAAGIVVTSTRVKADLRRARERLQDDTAAARTRSTFERRHTTVEPGPDGGAALVLDGLASEWIPVGEALQKAAVAAHGVQGETRTVSQLRHDIALDILTDGLVAPVTTTDTLRVPARKPIVPTLILTVPVLGWLGVTKEQAILSGYGPIAMEQAKSLAGAARSFIRVMTDPTTGARLIMDRKTYTPPADLARWVRIRDGRTRFPGKSTPAHLADIDHAREWQDGGPTNADNLITLDRPSHNAKSAGLYGDALRDDGVAEITDPWGRVFQDPPDDPLDPASPELLEPAPDPDEPCPF